MLSERKKTHSLMILPSWRCLQPMTGVDSSERPLPQRHHTSNVEPSGAGSDYRIGCLASSWHPARRGALFVRVAMSAKIGLSAGRRDVTVVTTPLPSPRPRPACRRHTHGQWDGWVVLGPHPLHLSTGSSLHLPPLTYTARFSSSLRIPDLSTALT